MTPVVAVAAIVFDDAGRVLLVERGRPPGEGLWSVPGGKLEGAETLAQAVAREVREETGLLVEVGALACVVERITEHHHYVILDYHARAIGGTLAAASDVRAARFVEPHELAALPLTEGLADVLARAREHSDRNSSDRSSDRSDRDDRSSHRSSDRSDRSDRDDR